MALVLNDEQLMLRDAARHFLADRAPVSHLRELRELRDPDGFSRALWNEFVEMGWTGILVPEEYGGLDYGYTGMGLILEECGRNLTPSPLLSTSLVGVASLVLAGSPDQRESVLPAVVSGQHLLALACDEGCGHGPEPVECAAEMQAGRYILNGRKTAVVDGHVAHTFIVSARTGSGVSLFLVPADAPGVTAERYAVLDTHAAATVEFNQVDLGQGQLLGTPHEAQPQLDQILDVARIGVAAEMLGIAQEAFEQTVDYLKQRKQFGVLIGNFQALQHRAALLFGELELCKSLVLKALHSLDEGGDGLAELASLTKAKLGEVTQLATAEAIQMHGGIGMTDDFDIGFFIKRYRILESLYGDRNFHLDRFASLRGY
ncbi:acyl-CoA dehydrogenase family protein [Pseudomonadota bacterium]